MLPPFVPPSARAASEKLPLITDFVIGHVEHSFDNSFRVPGNGEEGGVATLPSIQEFVREAEQSSADDDEFVQRTSRNPWGAYEAQREVAGEVADAPEAPAASRLEPDLLLDQHHHQAGSHDAVVNEMIEPVDAWTASAAPARTDATPAEAGAREAASTAAPEVWVAEERDSFDWHAAANLAVPPAEAQRAADEWSSTEWDRSNGSVQDHIATMLAQISRRVRSGELEVQGSKQMGTEAALVAALSALLAESTRS
ncbi:MAG: hypothetical protein ABI035_01650 [Gemmatimonadaceae bacterium]